MDNYILIKCPICGFVLGHRIHIIDDVSNHYCTFCGIEINCRKGNARYDRPEIEKEKDEVLETKTTVSNGAYMVEDIDPNDLVLTDEDSETTPVDPKQSQAVKKMTFDNVSHTAMLLPVAGANSGADKYGPHNWLKLPNESMSTMTYINAAFRHLILYRAGQERTSDSDVHNIDSIITGLSVFRDALLFGKVKDDRIKLSQEQLVILEKIINQEIKL